MAIQLSGRAAIITGAGGGIGTALVRRAVAEGMTVHAWDNSLAFDQYDEGSIRWRRIDVTDGEAVRHAAEEVFVGSQDVGLVCANAGILRSGRAWEIPLAEWRRLIDVNIFGIATILSACVPRLTRQPNRSHLLLTGSQSSFVARPGNAAYSASKHAVWCLAESLLLELAEAGAPVGVSLLAPGPVRTGLARDIAPFDEALRQIGLDPDEVARRAFDAIRDDRFWIVTHEDFKPEIERRIAALVTGRRPGP